MYCQNICIQALHCGHWNPYTERSWWTSNSLIVRKPTKGESPAVLSLAHVHKAKHCIDKHVIKKTNPYQSSFVLCFKIAWFHANISTAFSSNTMVSICCAALVSWLLVIGGFLSLLLKLVVICCCVVWIGIFRGNYWDPTRTPVWVAVKKAHLFQCGCYPVNRSRVPVS